MATLCCDDVAAAAAAAVVVADDEVVVGVAAVEAVRQRNKIQLQPMVE